MMKFVIQQFKGKRGGYYLRFEREGVLKSWAIAKGLPGEPGKRHLASQVGDGDLALAEYEGRVERGKFGAGKIALWDKGTYVCHEWGTEKIVFTLSGSRIKESYALVRFRSEIKEQWLIGQAIVSPSPPPLKTKSSPPQPIKGIKYSRPKSTPKIKHFRPRFFPIQRLDKPLLRLPRFQLPSFDTDYSKEDWFLFLLFFIGALILFGVIVYALYIA